MGTKKVKKVVGVKDAPKITYNQLKDLLQVSRKKVYLTKNIFKDVLDALQDNYNHLRAKTSDGKIFKKFQSSNYYLKHGGEYCELLELLNSYQIEIDFETLWEME